jgi:hypothetical protein
VFIFLLIKKRIYRLLKIKKKRRKGFGREEQRNFIISLNIIIITTPPKSKFVHLLFNFSLEIKIEDRRNREISTTLPYASIATTRYPTSSYHRPFGFSKSI